MLARDDLDTADVDLVIAKPEDDGRYRRPEGAGDETNPDRAELAFGQ